MGGQSTIVNHTVKAEVPNWSVRSQVLTLSFRKDLE
jgi:hypothetical protein